MPTIKRHQECNTTLVPLSDLSAVILTGGVQITLQFLLFDTLTPFSRLKVSQTLADLNKTGNGARKCPPAPPFPRGRIETR